MQMGPYLHPLSRVFGVWPLRILISSCLGFLMVHRLRDLRDLDQAVRRADDDLMSMISTTVGRTSRSPIRFDDSQRVALEERDDHSSEIGLAVQTM